MSKKIAAGAQAIVLDVKVGDGAFMKTARGRARARRDDGRARAAAPAARSSACSPTWTSRSAARSATRSRSARRTATLRGEGPPDFTELVLAAVARLLALSDLGIDQAEGRARAEQAIADGSARRRVRALDPRAGRRPGRDAPADGAGRAPVPAPARRLRRPDRRDPGRPRGARARRRAGATKATRSTTRSASSVERKRGDQVERGRAARGDPRPRRGERPTTRSTRCSPPTRSPTSRLPAPDRPRRRQLTPYRHTTAGASAPEQRTRLPARGDRVGVDDRADGARAVVVGGGRPADRLEPDAPRRHGHAEVFEVHRAEGGTRVTRSPRGSSADPPPPAVTCTTW